MRTAIISRGFGSMMVAAWLSLVAVLLTVAAAEDTQPTLTLAPYSIPSPTALSPVFAPSASASAPTIAGNTAAPSASPSSAAPTSEAELETLTWDSIRATVLASVIFMILLVAVFEIGRRTAVLGEVFDRKRETRPGRTPPKLISSASKSIFGWVWYIGEYFYVDGYVYPEYAAYAKRIQEEKEKEEAKQQEGFEEDGDKAGQRRMSIEWPSITVPWDKRDAQDESKEREEGEEEDAPEDDEESNMEAKEGVKTGGAGKSIDTGAIPALTGDESEETEKKATKESDVAKEETPVDDSKPSLSLQLNTSSSSSLPSPTSTKNKPPSRWRYLCVRPGSSIGSFYNYRTRKKHGPMSPRHFRELTGERWRASATDAYERTMTSEEGEGEHKKRPSLSVRLQRIIPVLNPLQPTEPDRELLRCVGLDTYTMIRFLRLGFEVTFWPFVAACITLIPTYYTNDYEGEFGQDESSETGFSTSTTTGYFRITINRLENGSYKLLVVWFYAIAYYLVLLRRIWVEWVVFVELREDFLANGDPSAIEEDDDESLKQFRNSCIVEHVPPSHRRDKDMFIFYDSLFPGQVRRAEMIVNSSHLTTLIQERQRYIERYESIYAKQIHQEREHKMMTELFQEGKRNGLGCKRRKPTESKELKFRVGGGGKCCSGRGMSAVVALSHYMSEIRRMNALVDEEYASLVKRKKESERAPSVLEPKRLEATEKEEHSDFLHTLHRALWHHDNDDGSDGPETLVDCGNGFVEFTTRATKQAALQMNLTGLSSYFQTDQAPDVRDLMWQNITASRATISRAYYFVQLLLFIGILFWSALVGLIGSIESAVNNWAVQNDIQIKGLTGFIAGYLPVLLLIIVMAIIPSIFTFLAVQIIRFRSRSEADKFVMKWNLGYRIANFCVILVAGTLYNTLLQVRENPEAVIESVANGVLIQSQFFFNVVLTTIGTGTSLQISQVWSVLYWLIVKNVVTEEAMSERRLEQLRVPKDYIFGRFTPEHVYVLMIAMVYSAMVPIVMGACSLYFFIASKVYTYQALFVFSQKYEGGGKVFYSVNRTLFVLIYVSIVIFATVCVLKDMPILGAIFLFFMIAITLMVDSAIKTRFSKTSKKLPLTRARIIDEEYASLLKSSETIVNVEPPASTAEDKSGSASLDLPGSYAGKDRRKMLTKHATAARKYSTSVGMGIGLPGLCGEDEDVKLDFYLYRQPDLHRRTWELEPRPYRLDEQ